RGAAPRSLSGTSPNGGTAHQQGGKKCGPIREARSPAESRGGPARLHSGRRNGRPYRGGAGHVAGDAAQQPRSCAFGLVVGLRGEGAASGPMPGAAWPSFSSPVNSLGGTLDNAPALLLDPHPRGARSPRDEVSLMPDPTPSHPASDRNLLFGILALQMDFIGRDALIAAMR